ncbi:MAG: homoserine dehydrogenase [Acidobacteriota bacterium]|nr:MAG: homoserine dehydrogenase [Acidobacteriota bacterium]
MVNVGVLGFGTVGTGVIRFLQSGAAKQFGIRVTEVAVSDLSKPRGVEFNRLTSDPWKIVQDPDVDIVVELIGGVEPAHDLIRTAIESGKSVVTANKAVLSRNLKSLFELARRNSVDLAFEAAVAGSIPIIQVLRGYRGQRIRHLTGIMNGTCNYILSRMGEGLSFEKALKQAQDKGFAEADHILDTGGFDARDKLAIVASLAYDTVVDPESIYCEGIIGVTPIDLDFADKYGVEEGEPGYTVKSLASARMTEEGLALNVYPALISRRHPLASVKDEVNAIYIEGELCGPQLYQGRGAGRDATASSVISDLLRLARNVSEGIIDDLPTLSSDVRFADSEELQRRGYVRMNLAHLPGSIAEASRILGSHGFNIEDSIQRRRFRTEINGETFIPDIVTGEPLPYRTVRTALADLKDSDRIKGDPFYLRIEA